MTEASGASRHDDTVPTELVHASLRRDILADKLTNGLFRVDCQAMLPS